MQTIYFVRHGEVHNPGSILYGRLPGFGLSDAGREQATAAGQYLAEQLGDQPVVLYSSPMQRAVETAGLIAAAFPTTLPVQTDERINEVHTPHDGTPLADIVRRNFDLYSGSSSDYEQPADVLARTQVFADDVRQRHAGQAVIAVTHGDVVVFLLLHAHQIAVNAREKADLQRLGLPDEYPATGSILACAYRDSAADAVVAVRYVRPY